MTENSLVTLPEKLMAKSNVDVPTKLIIERYLIEITKYYNVVQILAERNIRETPRKYQQIMHETSTFYHHKPFEEETHFGRQRI